MLAFKKASVKKLIIYISIMIAMAGGSVFMLYQNKKLTSPGPLAFNLPVKNSFLAVDGAAAPADQPLGAGKVTGRDGIDLTIFSSEKFKELRKNALIIRQWAGLGKRDIFKPN